jgi:hypothetical protein
MSFIIVLSTLALVFHTGTPDDSWRAYDAMRSHMPADERLFDRLRYFVGDALSPPSKLSESEIETWQQLVRASNEASDRHVEALTHFLTTLPSRAI